MAHDSHSDSHDLVLVDHWDSMADHRKTYQTFIKMITWGSVIAFIVAAGAFIYWY